MFDVITIGSSTRDIFLKTFAFRVVESGESPNGRLECVPLGAKLEADDIFFSTGGAAVNAATTFARQGFSVSTLSRIGNDGNGDEIRKVLFREGVDLSNMITDRGQKTAVSVVLLHGLGERSIVVYGGATDYWSAEDISSKSFNTRWLYISSLHGNFDALHEIIRRAKKNGVKIMMNPGVRELSSPQKLISLLQSVDILMMNREEASQFSGIPFKNEKEIFKKIDELEPGIFILTDGPNGAWVSDGRKACYAKPYKEKWVVDRTGAGDAFGSGFLSGIMRRMKDKKNMKDLQTEDIAYAIRLGSANATAKIEGMGASFGLLTEYDFIHGARWQSLQMKIEDVIM